MAWCYHHYRWRSHRHLRGPADLRASAEQRPDTIMDRICNLNCNQHRKLPVRSSFLRRKRSRVSCHFSHLFPRNHTSSAIRNGVLLGKTAHRPTRNPLTPHTTIHATIKWHTSNQWRRITRGRGQPEPEAQFGNDDEHMVNFFLAGQ